MLLRNKINSLSETGDIDKMMEYLSKAKTCSVDIYLSAYSSFVEKGHIAIAMPLLKEGLSHYPENQVRPQARLQARCGALGCKKQCFDARSRRNLDARHSNKTQFIKRHKVQFKL